MMLWFDRHRRLRDRLSAYIDGELDPPAAERLESHLAECERCRLELEQLRATVSGLRDLPELEPPRSFTLSPERVAAPRPRQPAAPPLAFGARIAAVGLAAALAAVLVVDLADIGGNGGFQEAKTPQTAMERLADEGGMEAATGEPFADEAEGAGAAEEPGTTGAAEPPAPGPEEAVTPAPAPSDGGIDALTAAEVGLAAALGVLVAASLALAFAGRKR
jgi:hypothetical protein